MTDRYFQNKYPDYNGEQNEVVFTQELSANITRWIQHNVHKLEQNLNQTDQSDGSVYTGHAGKKFFGL